MADETNKGRASTPPGAAVSASAGLDVDTAQARAAHAGVDVPVVIEDLTVSFPGYGAAPDIRAVRGVSLSVGRGECLGVVGESGSGKSVSALALLGLLPKNAVVGGRIRVKGRDLLSAGEEEKRNLRGSVLAMIFQEPSRSFDPIYSIGKTFEETFRAKNPSMKKDECAGRAVKLLKEVHIPKAEERLKNFPHQFSGGMLQRIMIALALANDPEILVADEPTTALDVSIQAQIIGLLKELQRSRGLSLLFISHDLALVGQIADRIQVMYGGLAMESGEARRVLETPRSPYTAALLKSRPRWGSHYRKEALFTIPGGVPDPARPEPGCPFAPRCPQAVKACRNAVPPLADDGGQVYRCLFPGVKL